MGKWEEWDGLKTLPRKGLLNHGCGLGTMVNSVTIPQAILKNLTDALGGYYHCYSLESEVSLLQTSCTHSLPQGQSSALWLVQVCRLCHELAFPT